MWKNLSLVGSFATSKLIVLDNFVGVYPSRRCNYCEKKAYWVQTLVRSPF